MFTKRSAMFYLVDTHYSPLIFFVMMSVIPHLRKLSKCELMESKYKFLFIFFTTDSFPLVFASEKFLITNFQPKVC